MAITFNHNDKFYVNGSNVGIGTDSPNGKLDIVLDSIGGLKIDTNSDGGATITTYQGSTNSNVRQIEFNVQNFQVKTGIPQGTSTTDALFIDSSQNVGIGTTDPDLKLHLAHSDGNNGLLLEHTSQASGFQVLQNIRETEGLIWQRWTNGTFASNLMTLTYSGELGIGTTSPDQKLQIHDSSSTGVYLHVTNSTTGEDGGNGALFGISSNEEALVWNYENTATRFSTNGSERMRIASDGNVGIGTTSPNVPLEIQGADIITTSTTTATSVLRLVRDITDASFPNRKNSAVDFMLSRQQTVNNNLPYTRLDIRLAGTTDSSTPSLDVMSLLHNGNVGIGKTDPSAPLHINGGSTNQVVKIQSNSAPYIRFKEGGTDVGFIQFGTDTYISNQKDGTLNFRTNNTDKMTILSNGNVGIGTTNPTRDLHIVKSNDGGQVRFQIINTSNTADSTSVISIYNGGADGGDPFLHWKIDAQQDWSMGIDNSDADKLKISKNFGPGTNDYLTVDTSGNVGIGTTDPADRLDVTDGNAKMVFGAASSDRPLIYFQHNAVPVDGEEVGLLDFRGYNDASQDTRYVILTAKAEDVTDGSEDGSLSFMTMADGTATHTLAMRSGKVGIGTTSPNVLFDVNNSAIGEYAYFGSGLTRQLRLSSYNTVSDHAGHKINASSSNGEIILATGGTDAITIKNDQTVQLNAYGSGYLKTDASGNITVDTDTIEDTLQSVTDRGATSSNTIEFTGSANAYVGIQGETDVNLKIGTGAGSEPRMYLFGSANGQSNAGNVFIGTANNTGVVDINGDVYVNNSIIRVSGNNSGTGIIDVDPTYGAYRFYDGSTFRGGLGTGNWASVGASSDIVQYLNSVNYYISNGTTALVKVESGGNVGIGTTSPSAKLHVVGDGLFDVQTLGGGTKYYVAKSLGTTSGGPNSGYGVYILLEYYATDDRTTFGTIVGTRSGSASAPYVEIKVRSFVDQSSTTNRNVSIECDSAPFNTVEAKIVTYDSVDYTAIYIPEADANRHPNRWEFTGWHSQGGNSLKAINGNDANITNVAALTSYKTPVKHLQSDLYVTEKVGIGTTSPSATLTVIGNQLFDGTGINLKRTGVLSGRTWNFGVDSNGLSVYDINSSSYRLTIDETGNVGIGTTSPAGKLHVAQSTGTVNELYITQQKTYGTGTGTSERAAIVLGISESGIAFSDRKFAVIETGTESESSSANSFLAISTRVGGGVNERMRITSGGNVGIGTSGPIDKLQVNGNLFVTSKIYNGSSNDSAGITFPSSTTRIDGYNGITFHASSTNVGVQSERMRITSAGNVGIGTTAPQQALHIKGATNGLMMLEGDNDNGIAGCYYKTEDTDNTMNRTKGFFGFQGNNAYGNGYFTMWLDNANDNGTVTASQERFRWERDGDFHADGDVIAYSTTTPSDIRLKTDVETIESASEKVSKLRGVE